MQRMRVSLLALTLFLTACQTVQYTERKQVLLVSASQEKQMGAEAYAEILKKAKLSTNHDQVDLIRRVGRNLSKVADKPDFQWEFSLIEDDKMINAFCLPGGKVAFYTGILPVTAGELGVAVVMSHEIAHALARHGGERMSQGQLLQAGGRVVGALLGGQTAAAQESGAQAYVLAATLGLMLPHSRAQESEADKIGLILMVKAGYDPEEAVAFWKRMEDATKGKGSDSPIAKFVSTHPTSQTRQDQIRAWLPEIKAKYGKQGG